MRKKCGILSVTIIFVVLSFQSLSANYYHYKLVETPYTLKNKGAAKLQILSKQDWKYYLFGVYKMPFSLLSGWNLYLFPNNKYIVTYWCDICKEETVDQGMWGISEDKIYFVSDNKIIKKHFLINHDGSYKKFKFFVIGDSYAIKSSVLISDSDLPELKNKKEYSEYLERFIPYSDWEKDYLRLIK